MRGNLRQFSHLLDHRLRRVRSQDMTDRDFQQFVTAIANAGDRGLYFFIRNDPDPLRWLLVGIKDAAADHRVQAAGNGIRDVLPSAPAVVLPMTNAPGADRKAIVVYSAWLW